MMEDMERLVREHMMAAVRDCFGTTLSIELADNDELRYPNQDSCMICSVGFAGQIEGTVSIVMPDRQACALVGQMLGMEFPEVTADVRDGFGELGNLIAGGFKNRMSTAGYPCDIAVPTTIEGQRMEMAFPAGVTVVRRHFQGVGAAFDVIVDFKPHRKEANAQDAITGAKGRAAARFKAILGTKPDNNIANDI